MWHEARRLERKMRGMMVDHKKRAERRREFYERIHQSTDPSQFLRVYGRAMKIHIDPAIAMAATAPQSMMPWNGDSETLIDRFDVRANLDTLPDGTTHKQPLSGEELTEQRKCNYERYRSIIENDCAGVSEELCLQQIFVDEQYGAIQANPTAEEEKKKLAKKKAAIGFTYDEKPAKGENSKLAQENATTESTTDKDGSEDSDETDVEDADLDISIDVTKITRDQAHMLNECAHNYGMIDQDFIMMLLHDREEQEELREARQLEEQRAQYSGRKSRRERRAYKDKRLQGRTISPPSYAAVDSFKPAPRRESSSSSSRSGSEEREKVKFITSFGQGSDEDEGVMQGPELPPKQSPAPCSRSKYKVSQRTRSDGRKSHRPSSQSSQSKSRHSRSRSNNRSRSESRKSRSPIKRKSKSTSPKFTLGAKVKSKSRSKSPPAAPQTIKRYRRPSLDSSKESDSSDTEAPKPKKPSQPTPTSSRRDEWKAKEMAASTREKLQRKMQMQIKRTFQAERKAEMIKQHQKEEERLNREEELRARTIELRRRERERRHREGEVSSGSDSDSRRRQFRRDSCSPPHRRDHSASRSPRPARSRSPRLKDDRRCSPERRHEARSSDSRYRDSYSRESRYDESWGGEQRNYRRPSRHRLASADNIDGVPLSRSYSKPSSSKHLSMR